MELEAGGRATSFLELCVPSFRDAPVIKPQVRWYLRKRPKACRRNMGRGWALCPPRTTAPFQTCVCSATSGLLSSYEGHLRNLLEAWQGNRDASQCEAGDPGSLSSCPRDVGIPINFQEESGIVTF